MYIFIYFRSQIWRKLPPRRCLGVEWYTQIPMNQDTYLMLGRGWMKALRRISSIKKTLNSYIKCFKCSSPVLLLSTRSVLPLSNRYFLYFKYIQIQLFKVMPRIQIIQLHNNYMESQFYIKTFNIILCDYGKSQPNLVSGQSTKSCNFALYQLYGVTYHKISKECHQIKIYEMKK